MTRLGYSQYGNIYKTDNSLVTRASFCDIPTIPCQWCTTGEAPEFIDITLSSITSPLLEDNNCDSCESYPATYTLQATAEECIWQMQFCQCAGAVINNGSIQLEITGTGSEVTLTLKFVSGGSVVATYSKTFIAPTLDCFNLNEVLDYVSDDGVSCINWDLNEVIVESPGTEPFIYRGSDCPYCTWKTSHQVMEFRVRGDRLTQNALECSCFVDDEWYPLYKANAGTMFEACCIWQNGSEFSGRDVPAPYLTNCITSGRLDILDDQYAFQLFGPSVSYDYAIMLDDAHNCNLTYLLTYTGEAPGSGAFCDDADTLEIEVRPLTSAPRFKTFTSAFSGTTGAIGSVVQGFTTYSQSFSAQAKVTGNLTQEHSNYSQSFTGKVKATGSFALSHSTYEIDLISHAISTGTLSLSYSTYLHVFFGLVRDQSTGSFTLSHDVFQQDYLGTVIIQGTLASEFSTYSQQYSGASFMPIQGTLDTAFASYSQDFNGVLKTAGSFDLEHSTYSIDLSGNVIDHTTGTIAQQFKTFSQNYSASVLIQGSLAQEFATFEQSYSGSSLVPISGTLDQNFATYSQNYSGVVKRVGSFAQSFSTYELSTSGNVKDHTFGSFALKHSTFSELFNAKALIQGNLVQVWSTYEFDFDARKCIYAASDGSRIDTIFSGTLDPGWIETAGDWFIEFGHLKADSVSETKLIINRSAGSLIPTYVNLETSVWNNDAGKPAIRLSTSETFEEIRFKGTFGSSQYDWQAFGSSGTKTGPTLADGDKLSLQLTQLTSVTFRLCLYVNETLILTEEGDWTILEEDIVYYGLELDEVGIGSTGNGSFDWFKAQVDPNL